MPFCSVDTVASYGQLLSVPSYDDASLFDQVDIQPSSSQKQNEEEIKESRPRTQIVVDDPVKRPEQTIIPGMSGGYVTYRISTTTSLESFAHKTCSVRRRFRDIVVGYNIFSMLLLLVQDPQVTPACQDNNMMVVLQERLASCDINELRSSLKYNVANKIFFHLANNACRPCMNY